MNDEEFEKLLKDLATMHGDMEPSSGCPTDEMLLDYVYNELSEADHDKVQKHKNECDRCRLEILKLEADRAGWEEALTNNPDATVEYALGPDGVRRVREAIAETESKSRTPPASVQQPSEPVFFELNQDTIDRIAAAAAAEVLDNIDLHMAYWKKTRGVKPHHGPYTGLAQASGLGGDILPFIAKAISRAWEFCVRNPNNLSMGMLNSALAVHVSSIFHEDKALTGLNDIEISMLSTKISHEIAKALAGESEPNA